MPLYGQQKILDERSIALIAGWIRSDLEAPSIGRDTELPAGVPTPVPAPAAPQTKPAGTRPSETKPAETTPVASQPPGPEPADLRPAERRPGEPKPKQPKPAEQEPFETEFEGGKAGAGGGQKSR